MVKRPGGGRGGRPRRPRGGGEGGGSGGQGGGPGGEGRGGGGRGRKGRRGRPGDRAFAGKAGAGGKAFKRGKPRIAKKADYFMQPGRRGVFVVLHRPVGNRAVPKICGVMPSRVHAQMLITQLEKAESVVKDLFLEATDDGIEALEAILAACREEVMKNGPAVSQQAVDNAAADDAATSETAPGAEPVGDADGVDEAAGDEDPYTSE